MIKKLFFLSLFTVLLQFCGTAQNVWQNVGTASFSAGKATYQSLAMNGSTPYVAYQDGANGSKTTVMKFDGSSWVNVGAAGLSAGGASYQSLAFNGSTPYVAYSDGANSSKTTVMKFDGTTWVNVGAAGFSAGQALEQSLAFNGSTPYVAYRDAANGSKITVMKFNGTSWVYVGTPGITADIGYTPILAFDGSTPYFAFKDMANVGKATVMKFNGSSWVIVGTGGFSAGAIFQGLSFAMNGSTPYVAYSDTQNGAKTTVKKFDGNNWVNVGTAGFSSVARGQDLVFNGSTPYVAFRDYGQSQKTTVMKYDGSNWVNVGTAGFSSTGTTFHQSLAFNGSTPYVAYQDGISGIGETTVMKFDVPSCNISAITTGTQTACSSNTYTQEVTVTSTLTPVTGTLDVNGQSFPVSTSPQTVLLTVLSANGLDVDVTASFSDDAGCTKTETALFTAPGGCAFSTALNFDGANDYIEAWFSPATLLPTANGARTVDFWVKTKQTNIGNIVGWGRRIDGQRSSFAVRGGKAAFIGENRDVTGSITINDGVWHHVAISYDGTTRTGMRIYVDGVLDPPASYIFGWGIGKILSTNTTDQNLTLGRTPPPSTVEYFDGSIDELRIWDKELSSSEIAAIKGKSVSVNSPGLVAYFDFEGGVANGDNSATGGDVTQVIDLTGNYNGTVNGFARIGTASNWVSNNILISPSEGIEIMGNSAQILNGATPELNNHTNFGKSSTGVAITQTFTITNNGVGDLTFNGTPSLVSVSGSAEFTVTSQPAASTLAPGASTTFDVQYAATTRDQRSIISIPSTDPAGTFSFEVGGSLNTAINFDRANDYIDLGFSLTPTYTKEAWVRITSQGFGSPVQNNIISGNNENHAFWIPNDPGSSFPGYNLSAGHNGTWAYVKDPIAIVQDVWYHVAVTYDASTQEMRLYKDGVLVSSASTVPNFTGTGVINIGSFYGSSFLGGDVDEVRIWNRVLCQAEIQGRMNSSLQGNENGLVAYYDFEEGVAGVNNTSLPSTVYDKAGTNHGTMLGFTKNGATTNWVSGSAQSGDGLITGTTITWLGATADWNTISNWDLGYVPNQCTDVVIPVTGNNPTFSNNQAVNGIEVLSGATLTVGAGGCLWVGSTFINNGDFILEATTSAYAQYLGPQVAGTLSQVIGEAGWHNISSPFVNATLGDIEFTNGGKLQFGAANKCNINYYNSDTYQAGARTGWTTSWGSWECASGLSDPFDGSKAYNLFLDSYFASSFPVTMTISGTLRNMPIRQVLKKSNGGWNQLSNPFPSVIDWKKLYDNSPIENTYYIWDPVTKSYGTYMVDGTSVPSGTYTRYIAPYQGVFVKTTGAALTDLGTSQALGTQGHLISNADRPTTCPTAINDFYKTTVTGHLYIEAKTNDQKNSDQLAIRFGNGFSSGFKADEEAVKFFSPKEEVPSIFTIIEDRAFVISSFPEPSAVIESIPLGLQTKVGQSISFVATEIPEGVTAILEDKLEKTYTNLKKSYSFKSTKTLDNNRFVLHLGDAYFTKSDIGGSGDLLAFINNGELKFMTNPSLEGGDVELINMRIQTLAKAKYSNETTIDVSSYPAGVYLIIVKKRGEVFRQKIIIQ